MVVEEKIEDVVEAYGVSWGHYVENDMSVTDTLGTDSLGSCFAFIRIDKDAGKVFFAHVSSDGETTYLLDKEFATSAILAPLDKEIQYLYVKGANPNDNTTKRIKTLIEKYGGKTYHKIDYAGVALSPFKKTDAKIIITHCKTINASNNEIYKEKTEKAKKWQGGHVLEIM